MNNPLATSAAALALMALSISFAGNAFAAKRSEAQLRFEQERAACLNGTSNQERSTCLKEASAALQEAKRGNLSTGDLARNSVARCDGLPAGDRKDCEMRMQNGVSSGSVRDGGVLRESSRPVSN